MRPEIPDRPFVILLSLPCNVAHYHTTCVAVLGYWGHMPGIEGRWARERCLQNVFNPVTLLTQSECVLSSYTRNNLVRMCSTVIKPVRMCWTQSHYEQLSQNVFNLVTLLRIQSDLWRSNQTVQHSQTVYTPVRLCSTQSDLLVLHSSQTLFNPVIPFTLQSDFVQPTHTVYTPIRLCSTQSYRLHSSQTLFNPVIYRLHSSQTLFNRVIPFTLQSDFVQPSHIPFTLQSDFVQPSHTVYTPVRLCSTQSYRLHSSQTLFNRVIPFTLQSDFVQPSHTVYTPVRLCSTQSYTVYTPVRLCSTESYRLHSSQTLFNRVRPFTLQSDFVHPVRPFTLQSDFVQPSQTVYTPVRLYFTESDRLHSSQTVFNPVRTFTLKYVNACLFLPLQNYPRGSTPSPIPSPGESNIQLFTRAYRQVLEWGGDASVGVSLRGVSLFVSRMLLPSFGFFTPQLI